MQRLPRTLELIAASAIFAVLLGIPGGTLAAVRRGGWFDRVASALSGLALAVPVFVIGTLIVLVFAHGWAGYRRAATWRLPRPPVRHLLLLSMPLSRSGSGWPRSCSA